MKTILVIAIALLITGVAFGQQKSKQSKTATETSSISISNSDTEYALNASFNPSKEEVIKRIIIKALAQAGENEANETNWKLKDTYSIDLGEKQLTIKLDKEKASGSVYKSIRQLGLDIQQALTKSSSSEVKN